MARRQSLVLRTRHFGRPRTCRSAGTWHELECAGPLRVGLRGRTVTRLAAAVGLSRSWWPWPGLRLPRSGSTIAWFTTLDYPHSDAPLASSIGLGLARPRAPLRPGLIFVCRATQKLRHV